MTLHNSGTRRIPGWLKPDYSMEDIDELRDYVDRLLRDGYEPEQISESLCEAVATISTWAGWVQRADGSWFKPLQVGRVLT